MIFPFDFLDKLIREKYSQKDLISSGDASLPDVYWKDMDMNMNDDGMGAMFAFEMQNPVHAAFLTFLDNRDSFYTLNFLLCRCARCQLGRNSTYTS